MDANTAWMQISIGAKMFVGARQAKDCGDSLQFKVHSKPHRYIEIKLNGMDLYDVRYFRLKRSTYEQIEIKSESDIYCDMLSECVCRLVGE